MTQKSYFLFLQNDKKHVRNDNKNNKFLFNFFIHPFIFEI